VIQTLYVLILKFGPGNNFMQFKEALSNKTLEDYGALGKLIKKGTIDEPLEPDRSSMNPADEFLKAEYMEDMKAYQKLKFKMDQKKPKLYAMILEHLSNESLKAVQKTKTGQKSKLT
jgi:hypothetical protein